MFVFRNSTAMPLKLLRLKKSRQYNVVSKSLYVICVELLDSTSIECTLSAESVGQECLDSVCQRLGLHQVIVCTLLNIIQFCDFNVFLICL